MSARVIDAIAASKIQVVTPKEFGRILLDA